MYIFSKRQFLLRCLVMVQIFRAVIRGLHSVVISICDELELALTGEERTTSSRTEAYPFDTRGLSSTPLQTTESVNRSHNPAISNFEISGFSPDKIVPGCTTDRDPVPTTSQSTNILFEGISENTSFQDKTETQSTKVVNITPENTVLELKSSDQNTVLDEQNNSKTEISVSDPSNVVEDILTQRKLKIIYAETPYQTNTTGKTHDITERKTIGIGIKQTDYIHSTTLSDSSTAAACLKKDGSWSSDTGYPDDPLSIKQGDYINSITLSDSSAAAACSRKEYLKTSVQDNSLSIKQGDYIDSITLSDSSTAAACSRKEDSQYPKISVQDNSLSIKQGDYIDSTTLSDSSTAAACSRKDDIQYPRTSVLDNSQCIKNETIERPKADLTKTRLTKLMILNLLSHNDSNSSSENEQVASTEDRKTVRYLGYLKEMVPVIQKIETKVIYSGIAHYSKPLLHLKPDFADPELLELVNAAEKVLTVSNELKVSMYVLKIRAIIKAFLKDEQLSTNSMNRMLIKIHMKNLATRLEKTREMLFNVDEECTKLGQEIGKIAIPKIQKRR